MKYHISKIKKLLLLCFIVIGIIIILCVIKNKTTTNFSKMQFLKVYGSINYFPEKDNSIMLEFITKGNTNVKENEFDFAFDSEDIQADRVTLTKSLAYKGYQLWCLKFHILIDTEKEKKTEDLLIQKVSFNQTLYDIGSIALNIVDANMNNTEILQLNSCAGASLGKSLADYYAVLENTEKENITITDVSVPFFEEAVSQITIDDETIVTAGKAIIEPKSLAEVNIDFSKCEKADTQAYYISPVIHYEIAGKKYQMFLDYYSSGFNLSKKELYELGQNFN